MANGRRSGNKPWKHIYGVDRGYTRRVDRLAERRAAKIGALATEIIERYADAFDKLSIV